MSQGSLKELETHLLLAARVTVTESRTIEPILRDLDELGKMLRGLIKALNSRRSADPTP
ncbi:four helix bundle protein [Brevundimonas sp. M20]|uniref:four helix bundle protein n=1 Tax=Brevundimonas sp. M20 TaxID=2591463 RepID=UPI00351A87F9